MTTRVSAAASTALAAVLAGPAQPAEPLAAFPVATYLDTPVGVVALVTPAAVRLPNAVLLNPADHAVVERLVGAAGSFAVGDGVVRVGEVEIAVVRWWDPVPRLGLVDPATLRDALTRMRALMPRWPNDDDVAADRLAAGLDVLVDALAGRAAPDQAATALVGLGAGLTPAGDDLVAGALAALAILGPAVGRRRSAAPPGLGARLAAAAAERAPATTRLAADLTRHAAAGALAEPAAAACRALAGDGPLEPAVERLLAIGHTSGRDLAEGLLVGGLAVTGRYGG